MRVSKHLPRVFFETVEDAMQAGAAAIRVGNERDRKAHEEYIARKAQEALAASEEADELDEPTAEGRQ
jgi:hypothetical protein